MPSLGPAEILVILVVVLLVFGPNKMPEIGRQLARGVREFRRVQQHLSSELRGVVSEFEVDDSDHHDDEATSPPPRPGGDRVPTLPAKGGEAAGATREAGTPPPSDAAHPPSTGTEAGGESPPAQPSDSS
jgi:sec-independent protein translocase protein TatA